MLRQLLTSPARRHSRKLRDQATELLESSTLTMLDVGAADGAPPRWKPFSREIEYVAVEPDPRSSGAVVDASSSEFSTKRVITKGLWHEDGVVDLHLCQKPLTSSIYEPNHRLLAQFPNADRFNVVAKEPMHVTTVDKVAADFNIQIDAMKLDVQGAEYEVLRGATRSLNDVLVIEAEVEFLPLYLGQPLVESVSRLLSERKFELVDYLHLYRWHPERLDGTGQLVFADALYMKSPETLAGDVTSQRKFAALAVMYGRGDMLSRLSRVIDDPRLAQLVTTVAQSLTQHNSKSQLLLQRVSRFLRVRNRNIQSHLFH